MKIVGITNTLNRAKVLVEKETRYGFPRLHLQGYITLKIRA